MGIATSFVLIAWLRSLLLGYGFYRIITRSVSWRQAVNARPVSTMRARFFLDDTPILTCPQDSSGFDTESEVLARWLDLADTALAIGRRYGRHKPHVSVRIGPVRHVGA